MITPSANIADNAVSRSLRAPEAAKARSASSSDCATCDGVSDCRSMGDTTGASAAGHASAQHKIRRFIHVIEYMARRGA